MSSHRKREDMRHLELCVRCLHPESVERPLTEHHLYGRKSRPSEVVFICRECHDVVETFTDERAEQERDALKSKTSLIMSSRSLRFVIENRASIIADFVALNREGPTVEISPDGYGPWSHLGLVSPLGRNYYLIPNSSDDSCVHFSLTALIEDGVSAATAGAAWMRFGGTKDDNILNRFIQIHTAEDSPGCDLALLGQS